MALTQRTAPFLRELRDTQGKAKVGNRGRAIAGFLAEGYVEKRVVKGETRYQVTPEGKAALKAMPKPPKTATAVATSAPA